MIKEILRKISDRKIKVGIVGLGYVGLPLAGEFVKAGFTTIGFDIDPEKVKLLGKSQSYIKHIPSENIKSMNSTGLFSCTTDFSKSSECDAIIICVPTPLTHHKEPDMSYIISTAQSLAPYVRKGQLFSLESTTYPGTTKEVLKPILESKTKLKTGEDFFIAFSPEREDPNNKAFTTATIPKVVGADDKNSLSFAKSLYDCIICKTVPVSSTATAEATKLVENIFRSVNIAMVNELKVIFSKMGIDIWEVIDAAKTKPFGYMPFYPGPGLGGHCIPIDPFYLTWKAREYDCPTRFIELAGEINTNMPYYVLSKTLEALNDKKMSLKNSKVLLVGLAYKKNVDDLRESPSFKLWRLLDEKGAKVEYYDPYCPIVPKTREYPEYTGKKSVKNLKGKKYDLALIATAHDCVDHSIFTKIAKLVIDTRNVVNGKNVIKA
ncbi:MAG TPA: nucleotide sugar dehydrogenase [Victivallales bacterium]|nr:nucleotide sugar dehydrogenase [Victivallales bacterium]HPO91251.1 nucleotide sugar dehydrogenase [Victivallales bacterium]HRR28662.1 nucleotide sugar dehydrogenase [Victivallales bacterium]HRU00328.1 nucleotide sugar dehydrogenase [Victivallales bacterium]